MTLGAGRRPGPLQALAGYYDRMEDAEAPGWSREKFGWCIVIDAEGEPVDCLDLRDADGKKKPRPTLRLVPSNVNRRAAIVPNFLWDSTSYALGRTAGVDKRTGREHAAFVEHNLRRLAGTQDPGLLAFYRFLQRWRPERFDSGPFKVEMLDANVMFRFKDDKEFLHRRPLARHLVESKDGAGDGPPIFCLVTGEHSTAARLHPTIRGVEGAQLAGALLVSFNLDAFTSYGKTQGANAPTSEAAAFRYGAALNRLLTRDGPNRVRRPIGDATTVFWAEAADPAAAEAADGWFATAVSPDAADANEAARIEANLEAVARGVPLTRLLEIDPSTRFHVLGLSPNAARLSVRFWLSDDLDVFARRLADHYQDLAMEPAPWGKLPAVNYLLLRTTALLGKFENIPPMLAGEVMRAVLTGGDYPRSWLATAIIRLRAGDDPASGWHAAAIRAVLARPQRVKRLQRLKRKTRDDREPGETPMSLDREHPNTGYLLGRLFAVYELAQRAALGRGVKSTIRDKYFGAASATPASVFPLIIANGQNHLSKVRKEKPGWAYMIEKELEEVVGRIAPAMPFSLPRSLRLEDQGEFAIGYYHQRRARLGDGKAEAPGFDDAGTDSEEGEDRDE